MASPEPIPSAAPPADLVADAPELPLRTLAARFWPFARPHRWVLLATLPLLVAVPAAEAAGIWLFGVLVDSVLVPRDLSALPPLALAYAGLAVLGGLLSFLDDYLAAWVGERFVLDVRTAAFAHVQSLSLDVLDSRRLGDVLARLTADVEAIETFLLGALAEGVSAGARIVFFAGALLLLSWELALVALVVGPLFYFAARRCARLVKRASREEQRRSGALAAVAEESLGNAALVQSLDRSDAEVARFRSEGEAVLAASMAATRVRAAFGPLVDLIELAGMLVVLGIGTWLLARGELTLGGLLVFIAYLAQLYGPVRQLGRLATTVFGAAAGAERVLELLDEPPRIADSPDARTLPAGPGAVELDAVTYRYPGATRDALRGLSLRVEPGETVAVVGPSGAGKSTLARLLLRFDDPAAGAVRLDGQDVRSVTLSSLRGAVGYLAQEVLLPDVTVEELIAQGRPGASRAAIEAAARAAGAHAFVTRLPDGYATRVGQRGRRLSGGQRQRLAIARALVRDSRVLVLDEPTTGLDPAAREALLEPLERLVAGRTVLLISHDPAVIAWADRVVALEDGRLREAALVP